MPDSHAALVAISLGSGAMLLAGAAVVPFVLVRMPADHFLHDPPTPALWVRAARIAIGALLVLLGIAMLVLPGQGLLTIVLGLWVMGLRTTKRLVRRLLCKPAVTRAVNGLRRRAGRPELVLDCGAPSERSAHAGHGA